MQFKQPLYTCVAGALGLAVSAGAMAQDNVPQDKRFYVAPMVSYGFFDSDTIGGGNDDFGSLNVEVEHDLHVIGHEAKRHDGHRPHA